MTETEPPGPGEDPIDAEAAPETLLDGPGLCLCLGDSHPLAQDDEVETVEPARPPLSAQAMFKDDSHAESWPQMLELLKTSTATYRLATGGGCRRRCRTGRFRRQRGSRHASCQTCARGVVEGGLYFAPARVRVKLGT
jgi:hypothetical protein